MTNYRQLIQDEIPSSSAPYVIGQLLNAYDYSLIKGEFAAENRIRFGQGVAVGTKASYAKTPALITDKLIGVAKNSNAIQKIPTDLNDLMQQEPLYQVDTKFEIVTRGSILVKTRANVNVGDQVYCIYDDADETKIGDFTNSPVNSIILPSGKFVKSASANSLVGIEFNLPTADSALPFSASLNNKIFVATAGKVEFNLDDELVDAISEVVINTLTYKDPSFYSYSKSTGILTWNPTASGYTMKENDNVIITVIRK